MPHAKPYLSLLLAGVTVGLSAVAATAAARPAPPAYQRVADKATGPEPLADSGRPTERTGRACTYRGGPKGQNWTCR